MVTFSRPRTRPRLAGLGLLLLLGLSACQFEPGTVTAIPPFIASPTPPGAVPSPQPSPRPMAAMQDALVFSITEDGYAHLFAYAPASLPLTRLTGDRWNDSAPALSPDGSTLAFASDRNEYWDLYLLELASGAVTRVTDTSNYESAPSWSPDGLWLAYESNEGGNLDIILAPLDQAQSPIRLTDDPAADHSPAWSPGGRQVAFVSTRSGESSVWLADLDAAPEARFVDIGEPVKGRQSHPAWSPDGRYLAFGVWAYDGSAFSGIYLWDSAQPDFPPRWLGSGDWPAWSRDGTQVITRLVTPNRTFVTAYSLPSGELSLPSLPIPGALRGLTSVPALPADLSARYPASGYALGELWQPSAGSTDRVELVPLADVDAPDARLSDRADEAFDALRRRVAAEAGWDALASLQYAYVPLSQPLDPGLGNDWLYTGRAFMLNPIILNAGWMVAVREDINQQTYWRIYLRAQAQEGSLGEPLHDLPWDLSARYALDPAAYEQGGRLMDAVPEGYWVDFTALAREYGWERLPALPDWRNFYNGTRATEFAFTGGLDWHSAMLELYPPEILLTPTIVVPPTPTPTVTPFVWRTPTLTPSPTPRPTFTP